MLFGTDVFYMFLVESVIVLNVLELPYLSYFLCLKSNLKQGCDLCLSLCDIYPAKKSTKTYENT